MGAVEAKYLSSLSMLVLLLLLLSHPAKSNLEFGYYETSCPRAEAIIQEQVQKLYEKHGNTAVSWIRTLFHDCMLKSCDASILLENFNGIKSEMTSQRSFGMRNLKYIDVIKKAVEAECPMAVSCADILALAAREGSVMLGGPRIQMKTGRKDSRESYVEEIEDYIPNHNDSISLILSRFQSIGVDTEGAVALLGAHSVGRVHCVNLVHRLYPTIDPSLDPAYAEYLKRRCPTSTPDLKEVQYARNDGETPMIIDNSYYKNILAHKGLLTIDEELASHPSTAQFVHNMAADNAYFHNQFGRALLILSENNPRTGDQGEIRKDCRFPNY